MKKLRGAILVLVATVLAYCSKPLESNCGGEDFLIPLPVAGLPADGRVQLGDTIFLHYSLPLRAINLSTGGLPTDLSRFRRFLVATSMIRYDTVTVQPFRLATANGLGDFIYSSPHTTINLTNRRANDPTFRFYLAQRGDSMIASIRIIPRRRGIFAVVLGQGIIEDAICRADLHLRYASGSVGANMENFRNFVGVRSGVAFGRPEFTDEALGSEESRFIFVY